MKGHSRNYMDWLGQPIDKEWNEMARKKNGAIMKKWAQKGRVPVEILCFIIVTMLFIGVVLWLIKTALETGIATGIWLGQYL